MIKFVKDNFSKEIIRCIKRGNDYMHGYITACKYVQTLSYALDEKDFGLTAAELREIAEKLDELNGENK
ncbi:MAG: hypothetical protein LBK68_03080 [Candidatus Margulisbacteria bacterium]|nr:hypothetical protein [Candidatus Margulisiibacteriota bacterium]